MFYLFVFLIGVIFAFFADYAKGKLPIVFTLCIVLWLSFVGSVRDIGVGTDTTVYSWSYFLSGRFIKTLQDLLYFEGDKGFVALNIVANLITHKIWGAHLVEQFFTNGLIFLVAFKVRKVYPLKLSIFTLVYCCIFYCQTYNFMRQYCALAVLLVGFYFMLNRQWKSYATCQVLAFFFHSSSVLFITIPILYYTCIVGYKYKWHYWVILGSVVMTVIAYTYFYELLALLNSWNVVNDTLSTRYDKGDTYGTKEGIRKSLILLISYLGYLLIVAYKRKIFSRNLVMFLLSLLFMYIASYLLSFRSQYLYRLSLYFSLPLFFMTTSLICSKKVFHIERIGFITLLLLDWYYYIVHNGGCEVYPYHSKILGI